MRAWAAGALLFSPVMASAAGSIALDAAEFARGVAAVGERPSDSIALRQAAAPSSSFRLGAAYRAWRNAGAAVAYDANHPTGDGGDYEVLAEDCSDERIAFIALEAQREALDLAPEEIATEAALEPNTPTAWRTRRTATPVSCRR